MTQMLLEPVVPNVFSIIHALSDGRRFIHGEFVANVKMNKSQASVDTSALVVPTVLNDALP